MCYCVTPPNATQAESYGLIICDYSVLKVVVACGDILRHWNEMIFERPDRSFSSVSAVEMW